MKIYIRDISSVTVASGPRVRFSVTFADDTTGEPVLTVRGFTMDRKRRVQTPATRANSGKYYRFCDASEEFMGKLRAALLDMKPVEEILGPEVEGVTFDGNAVYEGEVEIV